jgi:hypothetical protein
MDLSDILNSDELALYFSGREADTRVAEVRAKVNAAFEKQYGTADATKSGYGDGIVVADFRHQVGQDYELAVYLPGGKQSEWREAMNKAIEGHGLERESMADLKRWLTLEHADEAKFLVSRIEEICEHPDYHTEGSDVNKEARKLIGKLDLTIQNILLRNRERNQKK